MAAENIYQLYLTNPITTNVGNDLMYFGRSPYGATNDAVMTYTDFIAQFVGSGTAGQIGYYASNGALISGANLVAGAGIAINLVGNTFTVSTGGSAPVGSVEGTANEVIVNGTTGTPETGAIVLTTPQAINTTAAFQVNTVQFNSASGLLDSNGNVIVALNAGGIPVNHLNISNANTLNAPILGVAGTDGNIGVTIKAKGTGAITLVDGNGNNLLITETAATAVNYLTVGNNNTGNAPFIQATGSDTNVSMQFLAQGTGSFSFTNAGANYFQAFPAASLSAPSLQVNGTDVNIGLGLFTKGTGALTLTTAAVTQPLVILSGTASQHTTTFAFVNSNASRVVTFPDATGTLAFDSGITAWTPVFTFATIGDLGVVYGTQIGFYVRVGSCVIASFNLTITPTFTTSSGSAEITGLPFASNSTAGNISIGTLELSGTSITWPTGTTDLNVTLAANATLLTLTATGSTKASTTIVPANLTSGSAISLNGTIMYYV